MASSYYGMESVKAYLRKMPGGLWWADDEESVNALRKIPAGKIIRVEWHHPRNYTEHKRFFAMLKVGFDAWEPNGDDEYKGVPVQKNFDRFRKDVMIAAGFWEPVINIKGETRAEPTSISFSNMSEEEFGKVYNAVANVLLKRILLHYKREDLDEVVEQMTRFVERGGLA